MRHRLLPLAALLALAGAALAADPHPFSVHDMLAMDRLGDPQVSPDGELVVFTVRETDLEANKGRSDLWLVEPDGEKLRRLTGSEENEWNPRWCMNGDVHFLTTRSGSAQVWAISPHGGEARQLTDMAGLFADPRFSPDGKELLFLFRAKKEEKTEDRAKRDTFKHITRINHKLDGFGYYPPEHQQLWVCSAGSGRARQRAHGKPAGTPSIGAAQAGQAGSLKGRSHRQGSQTPSSSPAVGMPQKTQRGGRSQ